MKILYIIVRLQIKAYVILLQAFAVFDRM